MKEKLKKITDSTINDLLQQEVIMPSLYFETFDQKSKALNIDFEDSHVKKELDDLICKEFSTIDAYMNKTIKSISSAKTLAEDAKEAISNQDEVALGTLSLKMEELQKQLQSVQEEIYLDTFTKTYNRKWLFNNFINEKGNIINNGLIFFIKIDSYDYVTKTHGNLIADNLLLFILNFIKNELEKENISFKISRYYTNQFIVLLNEDIKSTTVITHQIKTLLKDKTLKSKSGIMLQPKFDDVLLQYNRNDNFQYLLEIIQEKLNSN